MNIFSKILRKKNTTTDIEVGGVVRKNLDENALKEVLAKVRRIEIKARGLSNHTFAGEYHTSFKGRGMSFSEVREYSYGDDIRAIDWNVSARFGHPFVKVFEEERELTLMLLVDISASNNFGTKLKSKRDLITELCATLAFSASKNNDKVGVIFFANGIEKYIAPQKGRLHILYIIRTLLTIEAKKNTTTNFATALKFLNSVQKKRSIAIALSDFYSDNYTDALRIAKQKHDLTGLFLYDENDVQLPNIGLINLQDFETGKQQWINTADKQTRKIFEQNFENHLQNTKQNFLKNGAQLQAIKTNNDYIKILHQFFKTR